MEIDYSCGKKSFEIGFVKKLNFIMKLFTEI